MDKVCAIVWILGAFVVQSPVHALSTPPGVGVRLTLDGPVLVDQRGMTLYHMIRDASCEDRQESLLLQSGDEGRVDFPVTAPDSAVRRTCLQKHPPLLAPLNAKPILRWSIYMRKDGARQWAYNGEPLFASIKDHLPGDVNGEDLDDRKGVDEFFGDSGWTVALAPLNAPIGVTFRKAAVGLVLATAGGLTLYYRDSKGVQDSKGSWRPLIAPTLAHAASLPDWEIVPLSDGLRQWAYKGKPLYTYAGDSDTRTEYFPDVYGDPYGQPIRGWHVALLMEKPAHPTEVTVGHFPLSGLNPDSTQVERKVYATVQGITLYVIQCLEDTADRLDCDDVGDSPRYWLSFCGGEERCSKRWHPLIAPSNAQSIGNVWSVVLINPRHPWRPITGDDELRVWAFKGRPVFTYADDLKPGDHYAPHGAGIGARPLLAYDD